MDLSGTTIVRFRTALTGFHKGDVTNYISQTVNAHRDVVKKLEEQLEVLEQENAALRRTSAESTYVAELEEKAGLLAALQEENGLLKNRVRQLEYKLEEAEALQVPAEEETCEEENLQEKELEAYRRAEAMERRVYQRTQLMKAQLDQISGEASGQFCAAMESVKTVLAGIGDYLAALQNTSENLDAAMAAGLERLQSAAELLPEEEIAE